MSEKQKADNPEFFISRRGRQVGVHEVDLKGIDIDTDDGNNASAMTPRTSSRPVKKQKPQQPKAPRSISRKKVIVTAVVVALILALPLVAAELVVAQYRSGVTSAKADLQELASQTVLPLQKKTTVSADQLRGVATHVNDIVGRMCRGGMLDNAAGLYPRARTALSDCKEAQRSYAALTSQLYGLEAQARYLERLGVHLKPVTTPITDEYAVIGAQQAAWLAAAESIKKLSPPDSMKSAHADLLTHVSAIAEGWSKLNAANDAQDAVAFTDAEKLLSTEYEAVRSSSTQLLSVVSDTQAKLSAAYNALK